MIRLQCPLILAIALALGACATPVSGKDAPGGETPDPLVASAPLRLGADAAPGYVPLQDYDAPPSSAGGTDYAEIEGDYTGYDAIAMAMTGGWRSTDDPRAGLDVDFGEDGLVGAFTYDGEPGAPMALAFAEGCDGRSVSELGMVMFVMDSGKGAAPLCYTLNRITPDALVMTYLPRGNTLRYRRP